MRVLLLLLTLLLPARATAETRPPIRAHPMHTAVVEISYQPMSGLAVIRIRAFRDDFEAAVPPTPSGVAADSAMARYIGRALHITDRAGRALPLRWEGAEQSGDVVVLKLTAPAPAGLQGSKVLSALLCERFEDQVNIVRASYGGRTTTVLFIRGDRAKALP
jgi:hypothetical protein